MGTGTIKKSVRGRRTSGAVGVKLTRVFSHNGAKDFGPFLLLDSFGLDDPDGYMPGFHIYPHRGMETVIHLVEDRIGHNNSIGNHSVISRCDYQRITAGGGILHKEMAKRAERLWLLISDPNPGEAIAWSAPAIINAQEELNQTFQVLNEGLFIK